MRTAMVVAAHLCFPRSNRPNRSFPERLPKVGSRLASNTLLLALLSFLISFMAYRSAIHATMPSFCTSSSSLGRRLQLAPTCTTTKQWISLRTAPSPRRVLVASTNMLHKRVEAKATHSIPPEKVDILNQLERWAEIELLPFLTPVEKCWQPQDFLPGPSSEGFIDEVRELRARSSELPDDYLVCLVGDTITEEALPTYQTMLNSFVSTTGETSSAWAKWIRSWTAEENRHGDLLNKYLYLTGKVDMRLLEKTTHYLIASGMEVGLENNPYFGFIYTSFQERATFISHGNTARQAKEYGDIKLAKICGMIAADEKRHEHAYSKVVEKLFEIDPNGTMVAFESMMRKKIVMPAHLMYDGQNERLFKHFSCVAQRVGVYTAKDYADILEHFVRRWKVEKLSQLSSDGRAAQEYVCGLSARIRKLEERAQSRVKRGPKANQSFGWIFNKEVALL